MQPQQCPLLVPLWARRFDRAVRLVLAGRVQHAMRVELSQVQHAGLQPRVGRGVEQLEVHTWMLSQAEANEKLMEGASLDATEAATGRAESLVDYVASLEALLIERQAALATLQAQVQSYKHAVEAAP